MAVDKGQRCHKDLNVSVGSIDAQEVLAAATLTRTLADMAARTTADSTSPPPRSKNRSRRSASSSLSRSPLRVASRSPSKRLRRPQETIARGGSEKGFDRHLSRRERDLDHHGERDSDRRHHSTGRDRDSGRGRDREREDRGRTRDTDRARDKEQTFSHRRATEKHSPTRPSPSSGHLSRVRSSRRMETSSSPPRQSSHRNNDALNPRAASTATRDEVEQHNEELRQDGAEDSVAKMKAAEAACEAKQKAKEKPSFEYSGKLAAETNKVRGVTLLFTEPPEARKPTVRWRLYIFKDGEPFNEPLYIHRQSCYLFGRERRVADVPTDHPSCSKQHAVIQYRLLEKVEPDGSTSSDIRPYVMDLGSTNGTFLNGERLDPQRYYELFEKDTIKFGNSSREYVLLHEHSAG